MKTTILFLLTLTMSCSIMAQLPEDKKHELSIGLGVSNDVLSIFSVEHIIDRVHDNMVNHDIRESTNDKKRSGFYLSYRYHFNSKWALGTSLTYKPWDSKSEYRQETPDEDSHTRLNYRYKQRFYGINIEGQYTYFRRKIFRMYALAGVGVYTCKETLHISGTEKDKTTDHITKLTYQISPLCFELGTYMGIKCEYGYGYKGIGSLGLYYRF